MPQELGQKVVMSLKKADRSDKLRDGHIFSKSKSKSNILGILRPIVLSTISSDLSYCEISPEQSPEFFV